MSNKGTSRQFEVIFGWAAAAVIVCAIIGGLFMVGSPSKARDEKIDAKRLQNMQMTARVISCYGDKTADLPETLASLQNIFKNDLALRGGSPRCTNLKWATDPVSEQNFEYKRLSETSFQLCANFLRPTGQNTRASYSYINTYNRTALIGADKPRETAGTHCYTARDWGNQTR